MYNIDYMTEPGQEMPKSAMMPPRSDIPQPFPEIRGLSRQELDGKGFPDIKSSDEYVQTLKNDLIAKTQVSEKLRNAFKKATRTEINIDKMKRGMVAERILEDTVNPLAGAIMTARYVEHTERNGIMVQNDAGKTGQAILELTEVYKGILPDEFVTLMQTILANHTVMFTQAQNGHFDYTLGQKFLDEIRSARSKIPKSLDDDIRYAIDVEMELVRIQSSYNS